MLHFIFQQLSFWTINYLTRDFIFLFLQEYYYFDKFNKYSYLFSFVEILYAYKYTHTENKMHLPVDYTYIFENKYFNKYFFQNFPHLLHLLLDALYFYFLGDFHTVFLYTFQSRFEYKLHIQIQMQTDKKYLMNSLLTIFFSFYFAITCGLLAIIYLDAFIIWHSWCISKKKISNLDVDRQIIKRLETSVLMTNSSLTALSASIPSHWITTYLHGCFQNLIFLISKQILADTGFRYR